MVEKASAIDIWQALTKTWVKVEDRGIYLKYSEVFMRTSLSAPPLKFLLRAQNFSQYWFPVVNRP